MGYDITTDTQNNILIAGMIETNGNQNILLIKYDISGQQQWNQTYDQGQTDIAYSLQTDTENNIILTGISSNRLTILKYNPHGTLLWQKNLSQYPDSAGKSIAIDSNQNLLIAGYYTINTHKNGILLKLTTDGTELWNTTYGQGDYNNDHSLTIDPTNNIYLATSDTLIQKYSPSGTKIWETRYTTDPGTGIADITLNQQNDIYLIGNTYQTHQKKNYILLKYNTNGQYQWTTYYDHSMENDYGTSIQFDNNNRLTVTGFATNNFDNYDYLTIKYTQHPQNNFEFTPPSPQTFENITFTDTSLDPDTILINWTWNFGDGTISYTQHPQHYYQDDGTYTIQLTITDTTGFTDTTTKQITIQNKPPTANFTYTQQNIPDDLTIQLTDTSHDIDGIIINHTWDLGDTHIKYHPQLTHTYQIYKIYNVTLTITDDDYAITQITKTITVYDHQPPTIQDHTPQTIIGGQILLFNITIHDLLPLKIHEILYRYENQTLNTLPLIHISDSNYTNHIITEAFYQKLTYQIHAEDINNNSNLTTEKTITILDETKPIIQNIKITPEIQHQGGYVNISGSFNDNINITQINLLIQNPQTQLTNISLNHQISQNPNYYNTSYKISGTHTCYFIIQDTSGNTNTSTYNQFTILPNQQPQISFTLQPIAPQPNQIIYLNSTSNDPDGTITNHTWDLGDGTYKYQPHITHQYATPNIYTITLTITDSNGATNTTSQQLTIGSVYSLPILWRTSENHNNPETTTLLLHPYASEYIDPYDQLDPLLPGNDIFDVWLLHNQTPLLTDAYPHQSHIIWEPQAKYDRPYPTYCNISWNPTQAQQFPDTLYLIDIAEKQQINMKTNNYYNMTLLNNSLYSYKIIYGDTQSNIATVSSGWNIIGLPFNTPTYTNHLILTHNEQHYPWSDVAGPDPTTDRIYQWLYTINRNTGILETNTQLMPTYGYLTKSYYPNQHIQRQGYYFPDTIPIPLKTGWNLLSLPTDKNISIHDLKITHQNTDYSWTSCAGPDPQTNLVYQWIYTINRNTGILETASIITPGYGYWIKCHQPITLTYPNQNPQNLQTIQNLPPHYGILKTNTITSKPFTPQLFADTPPINHPTEYNLSLIWTATDLEDNPEETILHIHENASNSIDSFDIADPGFSLTGYDTYFLIDTIDDHHMLDSRPWSNNILWHSQSDLSLNTNKPCTITWDYTKAQELPGNLQLIDKETSQIINMKTQGTYSYTHPKNEKYNIDIRYYINTPRKSNIDHDPIDCCR